MSKGSTLKGSQTDWEALEKMEDEDIDLSEISEVTSEQIAQASLRVGCLADSFKIWSAQKIRENRSRKPPIDA